MIVKNENMSKNKGGSKTPLFALNYIWFNTHDNMNTCTKYVI
jgi:hypothetical protein